MAPPSRCPTGCLRVHQMVLPQSLQGSCRRHQGLRAWRRRQWGTLDGSQTRAVHVCKQAHDHHNDGCHCAATVSMAGTHPRQRSNAHVPVATARQQWRQRWLHGCGAMSTPRRAAAETGASRDHRVGGVPANNGSVHRLWCLLPAEQRRGLQGACASGPDLVEPSLWCRGVVAA